MDGTQSLNSSTPDLATQIAGSWYPCKPCKGKGTVPLHSYSATPKVECPDCKGTNRTFVFGPEVAKPCPNWVTHRDYHNDPTHVIFDRYADGDEGRHCPRCQGRGWVATQDAWKILEAVDDRFAPIEVIVSKQKTEWAFYEAGEVVASGTEYGPVKERTLEAIRSALVASGATLYEEVAND